MMMHRVAVFLALCQFVIGATTAVVSDSLVEESQNKQSLKRKERYVMPWMCLEICDTPSSIQEQLVVIKDKAHVLSGVSFERYTLGDGCTLIHNTNLTDVHGAIRDAGLDTWPMITSYPHPPMFLEYMRQVMYSKTCADEFISQCVSDALLYGYTGYNLDWEPTSTPYTTTHPVTQTDALKYAEFIETFSVSLHKNGLRLGVDVATWITSTDGPSIWDYEAIAKTTVDKAISMGTYTSNDSSFDSQMALLMDAFGTQRAGVGLQTVNATSNDPIPADEVMYRFDALRKYGVMELGIWSMPVPPDWWTHIEAFAYTP